VGNLKKQNAAPGWKGRLMIRLDQIRFPDQKAKGIYLGQKVN
jgi:hypothetical protein